MRTLILMTNLFNIFEFGLSHIVVLGFLAHVVIGTLAMTYVPKITGVPGIVRDFKTMLPNICTWLEPTEPS